MRSRGAVRLARAIEQRRRRAEHLESHEPNCPLMDDRRAHFLTMLGDVCVAAGLGSMRVELLLSDGTRMGGTPSPHPGTEGGPPTDETGYSSTLLIDGVSAQVEDVVEFVVRTP